MYFDEVIENNRMRSHARCECRGADHHHSKLSAHDLIWEYRGQVARPAGWEAHHRDPGMTAGREVATQPGILCWTCLTDGREASARIPPGNISARNQDRLRTRRFGGKGSLPKRLQNRKDMLWVIKYAA